MSDRLPMETTYLVHDALRRELRQLAAVATRGDGTLRGVLRGAAGWKLLRRALRVHHGAEDAALWPVLRHALAGRPYDLALLEAMEAEHTAIGSLIGAVDEALAEPSTDPVLLGDLVDALVTGVGGHLRHEEESTFPLVQAVVTAQQWERFQQVHARRIAADADRLLPWLLDGADERTATAVLAPLPAPVRRAYRERWRPAYAALDRWGPGTPVPAPAPTPVPTPTPAQAPT
ncbi:hemerythrin domain-containing protein [Kitasatospora sp. NPDC058218]|uniref:hemerythrin domain-containing protein n=1 Tax=Kitasatospora sp. NPDC058218 TaxID=3346385 RepID=UPI0036DAE047